MKLNKISNDVNVCDYCTIDTSNVVSKITNNKCENCKKFFCGNCIPYDYKGDKWIPQEIRNTICRHCYAIVLEASYRDEGFDAKNAWKKYPRKELHASGNTSAIHLGEIMSYIGDKHQIEAKKECLETFKELYKSSKKFLDSKDKK